VFLRASSDCLATRHI